MKRVIAILTAAALSVACLTPAAALAKPVPVEPITDHLQDVFSALRSAWGMNYEKAGDDVGGMYYDYQEKGAKVLLVNGGSESRRREIAVLAGGADMVSFRSCKYSYATLNEAFEELSELMKEDGVISLLGIDERENRVDVGLQPGAPEGYAQQLRSRFGDLIKVEEVMVVVKTDGPAEDVSDELVIPKTGDRPSLLAEIMSAVLGFMELVF